MQECLDGVFYHNHFISVIWDKDGTRYKKGKGFLVFCDGEKIAEKESPDCLTLLLK